MDEQIREQNRRQWSAAAAGWMERQRTEPGPLTKAILSAAAPQKGDMVLDLACGTGDPALFFADAVGPSGYVLGLDITPEMIKGAREAARSWGITNVAFRVVDSEGDLGAAEGHFDVCVCRCGLMFMPDQAAALRQLYDALRPGGRICVSTWAEAERAPAFTLLGEIASRYMPGGPLRGGGTGMFSLDTEKKLADLFAAAGFPAPTISRVACEIMRADDAESLWRHIQTAGGPMVHTLQTLGADEVEQIHQELLARCEQRFGGGAISLGAEALVTSARKPL